CMQGLRLPFTF
nr:immunoglobulin light chain junction region [Macaca mulatta]MOW08265.1 immunoglobulin light chain junction region [Macaca mulatta]MOW08806.1 immunoglobulin light chain junction region [Macaca mulatta]MOW08993.1 immunoglobulin light chain junction region [Macaca mulatta]MOW09283.1 immunoglobulin light chain junction region [Macaca mulatta]